MTDVEGLVNAILRKKSQLPDDPKFRAKFPELFKFLTMDQNVEEDKLDEPGGFSVFLDGSSWGWTLRVPSLNAKCRGSAESLFDLFEGLQRACTSQQTDWKMLDRYKEDRRRKSRKKT